MQFRLRTSRKTAETLKELQSATGLTPNILARYAVCMSLRHDVDVPPLVKDITGLEINRSTLTGQYDFVFKALITQHAKRPITDEEYFPTLFNAHLERGVRFLKNEYSYHGNYEKMITNLLTQSNS